NHRGLIHEHPRFLRPGRPAPRLLPDPCNVVLGQSPDFVGHPTGRVIWLEETTGAKSTRTRRPFAVPWVAAWQKLDCGCKRSKAVTRTHGTETIPARKEQCTHVRDIYLFHRPKCVALGNPVRWRTTPLRYY